MLKRLAFVFLNGFLLLNCGCGYLYYEVTDLSPPPQLSPQLKTMTYFATGKCSDDTLMLSFLQGTGITFDFNPMTDTEIRTAEIKLFLKEDWTYEADYIEFLGNNSTGAKKLTGRFNESNTEVMFTDLGSGAIVEINKDLHLILKFTSDILTPGLVNKEILLRITLSPSGKETKIDYCNTHPN